MRQDIKFIQLLPNQTTFNTAVLLFDRKWRMRDSEHPDFDLNGKYNNKYL
jgi:hypothetical protein